MNKKALVIIPILVALGAAGFVFMKGASANSTPTPDINAQREMMKVRYEISDNYSKVKEIESNKLIDAILSARREKQEEINKYISDNTVFVKNNGQNLFASESFDGDAVEVKRGDRLIRFDAVKDSSGAESGLKVKLDYNDESFYYIKKDEYITDVSEFIAKKIDGVDYGSYEKVYNYPSNPRVEVKGVFITEPSASNSKLDEMIELAKSSNINAFVIDVKDDNDNILFYSQAAEKYNPTGNKVTYIKDMDAFMKKLKDNNIYAIARIVAFKSPRYAVNNPDRAITFKSNNQIYVGKDGLTWASAYDRQLWEYNVEVAKEAAKYGFNEIQFDYVRFPASGGGKLDASLNYKNELNETKTEAIQNFLKYAQEELRPYEVYIAADVFGWAASSLDDVGIGQQWEGISNVVDYICPMVYPSHYGPGNYGFAVPDAHPYDTVYRCTEDAIERNGNILTPATIRPWIQDFTAPWVKGHIKYGPEEVRQQIKALEDLGINEYILWNAGNRYSKDAVR